MQITIESVKHAPELTRIKVNGKILKHVEGIDFYALYLARPDQKIKMIRQVLFSRIAPGKFFTLKKEYRQHNSWLNQTRAGRATYAQALELFKQFKQTGIEGARFSIQSRLIG